jgi:putative ABC transport system ATP-binding protein
MALFQQLNDQGITILLVTHEMEVSHYAKRIIDMRDGRILRDHLVEHRRSAAADLQTLEAAEVER